MFWKPEHFGPKPAWFEHAPFAFWLIDVLRPTSIVELGTHAGFSYFCFCQAVAEFGGRSKCFAIDTWKGDEHAGYYGEDVYDSIVTENLKYKKFSTLIRSTFDDALAHFADASVDLLHIDGRHFYEDVKHDYESWLPKLTKDAIVLFHDTNERENGFGVWKLFDQLKRRHAGIEFLHGHGLGVLAPGKIPAPLRKFFAMDEKELEIPFCSLGAAVAIKWQHEEMQKELDSVQIQLQKAFAANGVVKQNHDRRKKIRTRLSRLLPAMFNRSSTR